MLELLTLCFEFFKTGLFAVGGGLATLPFLTAMQKTYGWFSATDLANMIAVSESTPGPIGVNMATNVGYAHGGILSALTATLSLIFPSVVIICLIAGIMEKFQQNKLVQDAFAVIRPAVTGLIAAAGLSVARIALLHEGQAGLQMFNWIAIALFAVIFAATQWKPMKKLHPVVFIAAGAAFGILLKM